jgi:hypothetical protein
MGAPRRMFWFQRAYCLRPLNVTNHPRMTVLSSNAASSSYQTPSRTRVVRARSLFLTGRLYREYI